MQNIKHLENRSKRNLLVLALLALLAGLLIFSLPRYIMPMLMSAPNELDYSTTRLSEQGIYRASFTSELSPIALNQLHAWTLHVETAEGQAVSDATIRVAGGMPQHRHGMPTEPEVTTNLGNGDYRVEGMKFQMGGWWEIRFQIDAGGKKDLVIFNLKL